MSPEKKKLPVSIVITVKDDAAALEDTLRAFRQQTCLAQEIILVIAGSKDMTLAVAEKWQQELPQICIHEQENITRSEGRNLGVEMSSQDTIVFTDAGCIPEFNWLEELMKPLASNSVKLISGYTQVRNESAFSEAQGAFVLVPLEKIPKYPLPATRNMAIRKDVFQKHTGFRPDLNYAEDYEFSRRLEASGVLSHFVPKAIVSWPARESLGEFFYMILRLTQGDMQAGTWRRGQLTMWARYLFLIGFFSALATLSSLATATQVSLAIYALYLVGKCLQFRFSRTGSYFWAILFQVFADMAVLLGTASGLVRRRKV